MKHIKKESQYFNATLIEKLSLDSIDKDAEPVLAYMIVFFICFASILTRNPNLVAPMLLTRSPSWYTVING